MIDEQLRQTNQRFCLARAPLLVAALLSMLASDGLIGRATAQEAVRRERPDDDQTTREAESRDSERSSATPNQKKTEDDEPTTEAGRKDGEPLAGGLMAPPPDSTIDLELERHGVYRVDELLKLVGKATGRDMRVDNDDTKAIEIDISPRVVGRRLSLEDLRIVLAIHGVFLFAGDDRKSGPYYIATTNPSWRPREPRFVEVIHVKAKRFRAIWAEVDEAIRKHNKGATAGEKIVATPVESLGKILLRSGSRSALEKLKLQEQEAERRPPDPNRHRLFAYIGSHVPVTQLRDAVLGDLARGERRKVKFVIMQRGNRMLFRAPGLLGESILDRLKGYDAAPGRPRKNLIREAAGEGD